MDRRLQNWATTVKANAGWTCESPGCGELDHTLLEAHHKKPRNRWPKLTYDADNGECLCMYHHGLRHPIKRIRNLIWARMGLVLYKRYHPEAA